MNYILLLSVFISIIFTATTILTGAATTTTTTTTTPTTTTTVTVTININVTVIIALLYIVSLRHYTDDRFFG